MGVLACRISQCLSWREKEKTIPIVIVKIELVLKATSRNIFRERSKLYLPVDVEVGVSGCPGIVEAVLILRGSGPGRVWGRCGHHHEEWLEVGFILEKV